MKLHQQLLLSDFDGTLIKPDSMWEFLKFYKGKRYFYGKMIASSFKLVFLLKTKHKTAAKNYLIHSFFKNEPLIQITNRAVEFWQISAFALNPTISTKAKDSENYIVSASLDLWLQHLEIPFSSTIICSKTNQNSALYQAIDFINCEKQEKVYAIEQQVNLDVYKHITAFGDTSNDAQMLSIAHEAWYKPSFY